MSSDEDAASTCGGGKKKAVSEGGSPSSSSPLLVLTDDVLLQILGRLEGDPRDWARASCASPRLAALLRAVCLPPRLTRALPAELLPPPSPDGAPRAWAALHKLSVCCPGLLCAGVLLEPSDDFGLELDIGPDFSILAPSPSPSPSPSLDEASTATSAPAAARRGVVSGSRRRARRWLGTVGAHLATGSWTLSREQGNKLLASRFRGDRLYICDWPGCVHAEERRKYMVFRGVFHDFPRSQVRCALRDTRRPTVALDCAFCGCTEAWDLYAAFCLRNFYGYHDDGEPVVRAFVCENGHVAGAWTERPLYS